MKNAKSLSISFGQCSTAGRKASNQDYFAVHVPKEGALYSKGIAIAIADGISSSSVSHIASQTAINSFISDYYSTPDSWSVKSSAQKVIQATNSWLYSQSQSGPNRYDKDKGYVCTFSSVVLKSRRAHIFHCGDSRVYRFNSSGLELLTRDHRYSPDSQTSYLTRALGIDSHLEIDYSVLELVEEDIFLLATDGLYEFISDIDFMEVFGSSFHNNKSMQDIAEYLVDKASQNGSDDNISLQLIKVDSLPDPSSNEMLSRAAELPLPPPLKSRMEFDGYLISREIYISSRSHVYLAVDIENKSQVVIKVPSTELSADKPYLESLLYEEWVSNRLDSPFILASYDSGRNKKYLYSVSEYVDGITLDQWMRDNPNRSIDQVRDIIKQLATGLQSFHRKEMIHQDLRPQNIMIDNSGSITIIDFGSVLVAGVKDQRQDLTHHAIPGTLQYSAPEYFIQGLIDNRSDLYSLAVIAYQLLGDGGLPYDRQISNVTDKKQLRKFKYKSLRIIDRSFPLWLDLTIKKALSHSGMDRYGEVSEFIYDLYHPNILFRDESYVPVMERNPLMFWQMISFILFVLLIFQYLMGLNS